MLVLMMMLMMVMMVMMMILLTLLLQDDASFIKGKPLMQLCHLVSDLWPHCAHHMMRL
jgi:hypothetical protein